MGLAFTKPTTCSSTTKIGTSCSNDFLIPGSAITSTSSASACAQHCHDNYSASAPFALYYSFENLSSNCECFTDCQYGNSNNPFASWTLGLLSDCYPTDPGVVGDPHLTGAHGTRYDFHGVPGVTYCLVSDKTLHINVLLDGYFLDASNSSAHTWIRGLELKWMDIQGKAHAATLNARRGRAATRGDSGFLASLAADGAELPAPSEVGGEAMGEGGFRLKLAKESVLKGGLERDTYILSLGSALLADLSLNAETETLRREGDAMVHFNLKFLHIPVSPQIHGVLGQTFRPGSARALRATQYRLLSKLIGGSVIADGESGAGFLDGSPSDYATSSLSKADCKFTHEAWENV